MRIQAGWNFRKGQVVVGQYLETSAPGVYAGRRYSAMARPAFRWKISASSTGSSPSVKDRPRRSTCWGMPAALHRRAVFLEPALRCPNQLCRSCGGMGRDRHRRRRHEQRLPPSLQAEWPSEVRLLRSSATSKAWRPRFSDGARDRRMKPAGKLDREIVNLEKEARVRIDARG